MDERSISRLPTKEQDERRMQRLMERNEHNTMTLWKLIVDLACAALSDEGPAWSQEGLDELRKRVANAVPPYLLPDYFINYRDPAVTRS